MQAQLFAPPGTQIDTMSPRAGMLLHPLFAALWFIVIMAPADSFQFSPGILHASSRSHMRTPFLSAPRSSALRVRGPAARGAASSLLMLEPSSSVGARGQSRELAPQESALALTQPRQGSMVSKVGASRWIKSIFKLAMLSFASMLLSTAAMAASTAAEASSGGFVGGLKRALHFVLHLDSEMQAIVAKYGTATYSILWGIVFAETGLVVTPFLPGDSLLFACGALCGLGALNIWITIPVFLTAAIIGDAVNYAIGHKVGPKAFESDTWFLKRKNLKKTEEFYGKYGGKTIVLARFVPIVRTFAPFVAGVGSMKYRDFAFYNVLGAVMWTLSFLGAGFFFGNLPAVKHNFTLVVLGIVVVSVIPVAIEIWQGMKEGKEEEAAKKAKEDGA